MTTMRAVILATAIKVEMRASTYAAEFRMAGMPLMELMPRFWSSLERFRVSVLKEFLN